MPSQAESSRVGEGQEGSSPVWNCHAPSRGAVALPRPLIRSGECVEGDCAGERTGAKRSRDRSGRHLIRKRSASEWMCASYCLFRGGKGKIVVCFEPCR